MNLDLTVRSGDKAGFALAVEGETPTLPTFDVADSDGVVTPSLRESIKKEGTILYEKG